MKRKQGRPRVKKDRPYITHRHRVNVSNEIVWYYQACIRTKNGERIYLRAYDTRAEADQACANYLRTGERPVQAKRGAKRGIPQSVQRIPKIKIVKNPVEKPQSSRVDVLRELWKNKFAA